MLRKLLLSLVAVVALTLGGAAVAGAQDYTQTTTANSSTSEPFPQGEVISREISRDPSDPGDGAVVLAAEESRPAAGPLARTGLDTATLGRIALALFAGGTVLVAATRRPTRRA